MFKNRAPVAQSNRYDGPAQSSAKGSGKSKSKESFAMSNKRKRKAPTQVLDTMNKSISKDAKVKYRKALPLSWNNVESRIVQLALGLYSVIPYMCYRLQTAVTISNQLAKVRVNWAFIATLDYCAFWYHVFQNHIQKGRGFSAPGGLQHQIGHRDKPTMLVGADTMVQSNVNTFMSNFTGDRNLGSKVICPVCPRYDIALPVDNNDAQFNQRMLVPPEDRHIFAFNITPARDHPGKDHVAAGIGQTRCHGCVWLVGRYSPSSGGGMLAPGMNDITIPWQAARIRPWRANLWNRMARSSQACAPTSGYCTPRRCGRDRARDVAQPHTVSLRDAGYEDKDRR